MADENEESDVVTLHVPATDETDGETKDDADAEGIDADLLAKLPEHMRADDPKELIAKLGKGYLDARRQISKGAQKAPKSAEEYTIEVPEGDDADAEEVEALKSLESEENKPILDNFKSIAHAHGLTQKQFQGVVADFMKQTGGLAEQTGFDFDTEIERLGGKEKAMPLISGIDRWGRSLVNQNVLTQDEFKEFQVMAGTAEGLRVMNKLRALAGEKPLPTSSTPDAQKTKAEVYAMLDDPRYGKDQAFTQRVEKEFERTFGTDPAMSSENLFGRTG